MLELQNVTLELPGSGRTLVENFSFTLGRGDRAVVIGEEGNGKSTLLQTIYDPRLTADYCRFSGRVITRAKLAYLPQTLPATLRETTAAEFFDGTAYYEHTELLARLGVGVEELFSERKLGELSGGEKVKMQLLRLLLDEPDVLLLDEPTNDLDIDTLRWLEKFLLAAKQPVLFVSHDETLIERTANVILHLEQLLHKSHPRVTVSRCPYREYIARRSDLFDKQEQIADKQRADYQKQMDRWRQIYQRVEHEQRTISRGDPSGGRLLKKKMHAVMSTGRRLERESGDFQDYPHREEAILTRFDEDITLPAGKTVLDFALLELRIGERLLARDVRLLVTGPVIVGITGRNGAGKTTLLERLWRELGPRRDITAAYMPQDYRRVLPDEVSALDFLCAHEGKERSVLVHNRLASMRFTPEEMARPLASLSGGQRAKVLFLDMALRRADVLVLDEPTRNFSPLSAPVIRAALREFGGAILSVSHDRKYLREVCDTVYELREDGLHLLSSDDL
ncbi:MAG: ABC-F family ATP-binding cassette domain-containing protein [Oscillospiraceae bacterium]|nr:ABC-F family ATP-binding cassette domain-containing protein [Oscillospiraceae bacterium]